MEKLENILGYTFNDKTLLTTAFTHSTFGNEYKVNSNERLEFLGDSVLELIVREYIYKFYSTDEGKLTEWKKQIVDKDSLCDIVDKMGLVEHLKLGGSLKNQKLSTKLKSDLYESIVGAIYLDGGLDTAREFVSNTIDIKSKVEFAENHTLDYKSNLQELVQKEYGVAPVYVDKDVQNGLFVRAVVINKKEIACGAGQTKQSAEKVAAKNAIMLLRGNDL